MGGYSAAVFRFIDGVSHLKAFTPTTSEADEALKNTYPMPIANFPLAQQAVLNGDNGKTARKSSPRDNGTVLRPARLYGLL